MINIAIDGPSGAGKSSVAKALAKDLGYVYVDTGALYRAIGYFVLSKGISTEFEEKVKESLPLIKVNLKYIKGEQTVLLNGQDISDKIRSQKVSMAASNVSAFPSVRKFLFGLQLDLARENNCIMDGRDIGTVVLPNADVKIFLTASPEVRAKRRYEQLSSCGSKTNFSDVLSELIDRDNNDSNREIAPLKPADNAVIVDNSSFEFYETVNHCKKIIGDKIAYV